MSSGGSMRCKRLFWLGIALNVLGLALVVSATASALLHGTGVALLVVGNILAVRNCRL